MPHVPPPADRHQTRMIPLEPREAIRTAAEMIDAFLAGAHTDNAGYRHWYLRHFATDAIRNARHLLPAGA